jgi:hypothetical protein
MSPTPAETYAKEKAVPHSLSMKADYGDLDSRHVRPVELTPSPYGSSSPLPSDKLRSLNLGFQVSQLRINTSTMSSYPKNKDVFLARSSRSQVLGVENVREGQCRCLKS